MASKRLPRRRILSALALGAIAASPLANPRLRSLIGGVGDRILTRISPPRPLEDEDEYRAFLATIPLKFITPDEVIRPHRNVRNGIPNQLPPRPMWKRIREPLIVADDLRGRLGAPLKRILSAYRSPDYNAQCPGAAANSYHKRNLALDLVFDCPPQSAAAEAAKMRGEGEFDGGIGVYGSFIHIDTRGFKADWTG